MSSFEEEMHRFEAEIRRTQQSVAAAALAGRSIGGAAVPPGSSFGGGFVPSQVRMAPPAGRLSGPPPTSVITSAPPAVNKTNAADDDDGEDVFSKLAKYESDHKKEKKAKKKEAKAAKKAAATGSSSSATAPSSSSAPAPLPTPLPPPPSRPFAPAPVASSSTPVSATIGDDAFRKAKKQKRVIRTGGGQIWEDESLKEWDPNDFRLFCGDLGNDVTDEVLVRTFGRYPSFTKAKVIRDKRTNKTKGYGFVSFRDPADFTRAVKELNGKYVGSRPIKLRKSNWRDRNIDVVRQKQKLKQQMGYKW